MNTESSENEGRADVLNASVALTPGMINETCQAANQLRSEVVHDGITRAYRAVHRATTAGCRVLFTSEAHRHA